MTIQALQPEITITTDNIAEFLEEGFRFAEPVWRSQLAEKFDALTEQYGFGQVLVGPTIELSSKLPASPEWSDKDLLSLFVKPQAVPAQRSR